MNYELIYKVRKGGYRTDEKQNLRICFENEARAKADKLHQEYLNFLTKALGHDHFIVTNECCMADGILGHVYAWSPTASKPDKGHGKMKCVYCGCDDFDGF